MQVHSSVYYIPGKRRARETPAHWAAAKFVYALKGTDPNRRCKLHWSRGERRFRTAEQARLVFAEWFDWTADRLLLEPPYRLIPIPSKSAHDGAPESSPASAAALMAEAIRVRMNVGEEELVTCHNALRWDQELTSAVSGGSRSSVMLARHLRITDSIPLGGTHILLDDVFTSGGHLKAAWHVLDAQLFLQVGHAFIGGRTIPEELPLSGENATNMFQVPSEELPDWLGHMKYPPA